MSPLKRTMPIRDPKPDDGRHRTEYEPDRGGWYPRTPPVPPKDPK